MCQKTINRVFIIAAIVMLLITVAIFAIPPAGSGEPATMASDWKVANPKPYAPPLDDKPLYTLFSYEVRGEKLDRITIVRFSVNDKDASLVMKNGKLDFVDNGVPMTDAARMFMKDLQREFEREKAQGNFK